MIFFYHYSFSDLVPVFDYNTISEDKLSKRSNSLSSGKCSFQILHSNEPRCNFYLSQIFYSLHQKFYPFTNDHFKNMFLFGFISKEIAHKFEIKKYPTIWNCFSLLWGTQKEFRNKSSLFITIFIRIFLIHVRMLFLDIWQISVWKEWTEN